VRSAFYAIRYARDHLPWPSLAEFDNWMLATFSLLTSRLPQPELEQLGRRLQFSRRYLDHLHDARTAIARLPLLGEPQPPSRVVELLEPLDEMGWLVAWAAAPEATSRDAITQFAREWRFISPTLTKHDIQALTGLKPGPIYTSLLRQLRAAWLDGFVQTPEDERAYLLSLIPED
jgi:tRNA nucleotidyltransferase (CCA-adding enzyme)